MSAFFRGEAARKQIESGKQKTMKEYDYEKAKRRILEVKPNEAGLFMAGDKGWTYETVWEDEKFVINLDEKPEIAGITGSVWATPMLDMDGEEEECFVEIPV
jgi:hypothetical protein